MLIRHAETARGKPAAEVGPDSAGLAVAAPRAAIAGRQVARALLLSLPMSSPTIPQCQYDANTLSELSDAHGKLESCQDKLAVLVESLRSGVASPAREGAELAEAATSMSSGDGRTSAQRGTVVDFAGAAQTEFVRISKSIESMGKRIDVLRTALSPVGSTIYQSLWRAKRRPFIARVANGICGGCNMRVPSSQAASVLSRRKSEQCPTCARLLLAEDDTTDAASANG